MPVPLRKTVYDTKYGIPAVPVTFAHHDFEALKLTNRFALLCFALHVNVACARVTES